MDNTGEQTKCDNGILKRRSEDQVEFKTSLFSAKVTGQQVQLVILIAILFIPLFSAGYYHHKEAEATMAKLEKAITQSIENQEAMIYVLSLNPEDRARLRIDKPRRLVDMEYGRRQ